MSAADVVTIVDRLERAGLHVWIDGGWGVDALVGRQTRPHDDLDLVLLLHEVPAVERELALLGYERAGGGPPMSFESVDAEGRQVDTHPFEPDANGDGVYLKRDGTTWRYPARGFKGRGVVAGRSVNCLTAEVQVICHAGYDLDDDDLHDLRLLRPAPDVLARFGVTGEPEPLHGGTGRTWRVGDLVLKPLDFAAREIPWQAELFTRIAERGFRVAKPRPEIIDGWTAWTFVEGRHEAGRWLDIIDVGRRLHTALARESRPDEIIDTRSNPWETGDRVAWGERAYDGIDDLLARLDRVDDDAQLIHGDLTGNVLFHEALDPAVIDFAPYWRPVEYASAIVVADALCWEGAPAELADAVERQYLLRALIYRGVTSIEFGRDGRRELDLARKIA
jgi:Aminoglycoside-2''-adenylyltransferase